MDLEKIIFIYIYIYEYSTLHVKKSNAIGVYLGFVKKYKQNVLKLKF